MAKPIVAIVGRPNVGKSTLFNKLVGERRAIVDDTPGTTRDRIYGTVEWGGRAFTVVDTGGLVFDDIDQLDEGIIGQAQEAIDRADVIVFVVDARDGFSSIDYDVANLLRRTDKPVILVANKADNPERTSNAVEFYQLGMGEPMPVSATHGHGTGDLLDEIVRDFPTGEVVEPEAEVRLAIVGRPNVGKSSLVNALAGQSRVMVSDVPGTTRDAIDTMIHYHGKPVLLVDTAGIRRRGKVEQGIEKFSVIRAVQAVERADVAALVMDASTGLTAQDTHVAGYILDAAKGMIVVANKWDLVTKGATTTQEYTAGLRQALKFADFVPIIYTSAITKQRVTKIVETALEIAQEREKRIATAVLNDAMKEAFVRHAPPSARGKSLNLLYVTQADINPPTFVFFVNDPRLVHFSYQRYLENEIRARWGFEGTPIRMVFKPRAERE